MPRPWGTKTKTDQLIQLKALAQIAVVAVEQTMADAHMDEKKAAAVQKLSDLTKGALKPDEIDHLIEDAVFTLKTRLDLQRKLLPVEPAAKCKRSIIRCV